MSGQHKWSENETITFIELYINEECLWDVKSDDYKNKHKREAAYCRLKDAVNIHNRSLTIQDVKNKIKNIRSTYYQEVKKVKDFMGTGMGADDVYKPHIKWFDTLHAVMQMVVPTRKSTSNDSKDNTESQQEDAEEMNDVTDVTPTPIETPRRAQILPKKRKQDQRIAAVSSAIHELKQLKSAPVKGDDEFDVFGRHIASQLCQMPLVTSLRVQTQIQGLLAEARISLVQHTSMQEDSWDFPATSPTPSNVSVHTSDYGSIPSKASTSNEANTRCYGDILSEAVRSISSVENSDDVNFLHL